MTTDTDSRRSFLSAALMWGGLALGYGMGAFHFLRYLVPMGDKVRYREMFVGPLDSLPPGASRTVRTPSGETFVMARGQATAENPSGVRVLSDICPHLGCKVHWVAKENHFLCPCHMGIFDAEGTAIAGPPAEAGQNLAQLKAEVRNDNIYVMIKES